MTVYLLGLLIRYDWQEFNESMLRSPCRPISYMTFHEHVHVFWDEYHISLFFADLDLQQVINE